MPQTPNALKMQLRAEQSTKIELHMRRQKRSSFFGKEEKDLFQLGVPKYCLKEAVYLKSAIRIEMVLI